MKLLHLKLDSKVEWLRHQKKETITEFIGLQLLLLSVNMSIQTTAGRLRPLDCKAPRVVAKNKDTKELHVDALGPKPWSDFPSS